jgi:hypothetical protein
LAVVAIIEDGHADGRVELMEVARRLPPLSDSE